MTKIERVFDITKDNTYYYGYIWIINNHSAYYEIVNLYLSQEEDFWDCWIFPYGGKTRKYTKKEFEKLNIFKTPDQALYNMLTDDNSEFKKDLNEIELKRIVESFFNHDGRFVNFMNSVDTFVNTFLKSKDFNEFSSLLEERCQIALSLFEF